MYFHAFFGASTDLFCEIVEQMASEEGVCDDVISDEK